MKKSKIFHFCLILFFVSVIQASVYADGIIVTRPLPQLPKPSYLNIKYHRVNVNIDNQVAVTEVDQVFVNPYKYDLEGEYIFPLPADSAVSGFQMEIDGKMVEGKVLEKDEAKQIYEDIVRRQKDPALLEYMGRNMFRARVYPIPALGEKRIRLKYSQTLKADDGVVMYSYPLDTEKFSPKPLQEVTVTMSVNSNVPIKTFYSPSHKMAVTRKSDNLVKASYEETNVKPDKDVVVYYSLSEKDFGLNLLTHKTGNEDGFFLMFLAPRESVSSEDVMPKDVVFVLDRSGSMDDKGKMENAKKALRFCLSNLNGFDNFNIILFSDEIESFSSSMEPADKDKVARAKAYVDKVTPMGGTNIRDALIKGFESLKGSKNPKYIIFITDGLPTVGVTDAKTIEKDIKDANTHRTRIFAFGVGYDVNTLLLSQLAAENRGVPEFLKPEEDIELKISGFYKKISEPLLSDVHLKIPGVKTYSIYPKDLPDIFKGSQLMVVGRYSGAAPSTIVLSGKRGRAALENIYEGTFPKENPKNNFIPHLWALRRIGYLLEEIRQKGENKELVNEIIKLSRKYGIITQYTSFLVTEPEYSDDAKRKQPPMVRAQAPAGAGPFMDKASINESGKDAFAASKKIQSYQQADSPAEMKANEMPEAQRVKRMDNKTFYLIKGVWTDSDYEESDEIVKIQFGSDKYFELARDPQLAKFLSLGEKVLVKFKGITYLVEK